MDAFNPSDEVTQIPGRNFNEVTQIPGRNSNEVTQIPGRNFNDNRLHIQPKHSNSPIHSNNGVFSGRMSNDQNMFSDEVTQIPGRGNTMPQNMPQNMHQNALPSMPQEFIQQKNHDESIRAKLQHQHDTISKNKMRSSSDDDDDNNYLIYIIVVIIIVLIAACIAGFVIYKKKFSKKTKQVEPENTIAGGIIRNTNLHANENANELLDNILSVK